jgi:hypothetical protein
MPEMPDKATEVVDAVEHPVETAKALEHEAEEGESARTPLIALTGVTLFLAIVLGLMLAVTMTIYFVYGGR